MLAIKLSVREIERHAAELIEMVSPLTFEQMWYKDEGIPNSIGTLLVHLTGNLNHYFGAGLLDTGYVRDRDREFVIDGIPLGKLQANLREAVIVMLKAEKVVNPEKILMPYTAPCGEQYESLSYHIVRLATHFVMHVGQVDYTIHQLKAKQI